MDVKFFRFNLAFEADVLAAFERCPLFGLAGWLVFFADDGFAACSVFGFAFGFVEFRVTGNCAKRNKGNRASNKERKNLCFIIFTSL